MNRVAEIAMEVKNQLAELATRREELEDQQRELQGERDTLLDAPFSSADAAEFLCEYIDRQAASFACGNEISGLLQRLATPTSLGVMERAPCLSLRHIDQLEGAGRDAAEYAFYSGGLDIVSGKTYTQNRSLNDALFYLFGDLIKAKLRPLIEAKFQAPVEAQEMPSIGERRRRLNEIDVLLQQVQAELGSVMAAQHTLGAAANPPPRPVAAAAVAIPVELSDSALGRYNGHNSRALAQEFGISEDEFMGRYTEWENSRLHKPSGQGLNIR